MLFSALLLTLAAVPTPAELFPVTLDSTWLYQRQSNIDKKSVSYGVSVSKKVDVGGKPAWEMALSDAKFGAKTIYRVDETGVYIVADGAPPETVNPPQPVLIAPVSPGKTWKWSGNLPGQRVPTPCKLDAKVLPNEHLTVMGKDMECVKVETKMKAGKGKREIKVTRTSWYVPGIGLVQATTRYEVEKDAVISVDTLTAFAAGGTH
jgi:hypothetical protein